MKTQIDQFSYTAEFNRLFAPQIAAQAKPAEPLAQFQAASLAAWAACAQPDVSATQIVQSRPPQLADTPTMHAVGEFERVTRSTVIQTPEPPPAPAPAALMPAPGVSPKALAWMLGGVVLWLHLEAVLLFVVSRH